MKTILLAAGAALLAAAAPALAQDATPTPDSSANFTGGRAEIFGGWDRTRATAHVGDTSGHASRSGITGGVLAGYDFPIGSRLVAGPFASYALTSTKDCESGVGCIKSDRQIEGGARVGMKFYNDKALAYVKGAYVNGQFRAHGIDADDDYVHGHANRDGWRAGAGLQYALTRHAYVKAEYDYTKFASFNADQFTGLDASRVRFSRNEVLGGFGIQF